MEAPRLETMVLENLIYNEEYLKKVIPYLQHSYFTNPADKKIFDLIHRHYGQYNQAPTRDILSVEANKLTKIPEDVVKQISAIISELHSTPDLDQKWLLKTTEDWVKHAALYDSARTTIKIMEGDHKKLDVGAIPGLFESALGISFDPKLCHEQLGDPDAEARYIALHDVQKKIKVGIKVLDEQCTRGGVETKSMTILAAGPGVGKTSFMCAWAANALRNAQNVLYITLEMSEMKIAKKIDCNLLNIDADDLMELPKQIYMQRIGGLREKYGNNLRIKEYTPGVFNANILRSLLNDLKMKQNFDPHIIFVDYILLCGSTRIKYGGDHKQTEIIQAAAEEIRGVGVEFDKAMVSATQIKQSAYDSTDMALNDSAQSWGIPMTTDYQWGLISNPELKERKQQILIQLKNREHGVDPYKMTLGFLPSKCVYFDVDNPTEDIAVRPTKPERPKWNKKPTLESSSELDDEQPAPEQAPQSNRDVMAKFLQDGKDKKSFQNWS